ncbi:MAG: alpha-galactosidase [Lachnospiraceae bacterium]|nr:alpha-galactosidase [Lachnospiraceae bacterium]
MKITYDEKTRIFRLDCAGMTYAMGVVDEEGFLGHLWFGAQAGEDDLTYLSRTAEFPHVPSVNGRDRGSFLDSFFQEFPGAGVGDYRPCALQIEDENGQAACQLFYDSYRILKGKSILSGLPSTHGGEDEALTLEITMKDPVHGVRVLLFYTIFEGLRAVVRSARVINDGDKPVDVTRLLSCSVDMEDTGYRMLTLDGSWSRERRKELLPLGRGTRSVQSRRGITSHQMHPFVGLLSEHAGQNEGEVYGFQLVYSGCFYAGVDKDQNNALRVQLGILPEEFRERLQPGEELQSPEVLMAYSEEGLGGMTRTFHDLLRGHLMRSPWLHRERPVLINNWEATFFDFDLEKLLGIARRAKKEGVEMLVMDDGWFGKRDDDNSSLGDWTVNEKKLPGGVKRLSEELAAIGMKLGIWFEPEMISPDSDLYRAHPDWALSVDGRTPCRMRNQYVLDLTRKEIRDAVFDQITAVLDSADIAYVKWDMNRPLSDVGSAVKGKSAGSILYHYCLGMYELQERLITRYPELLLENCSGGGARFDAGMLFYSPQIWTSDDTDAIERLKIQEGTAMLYPLSAMGAHVSVSPSQAVGRFVPMTTRGHVALAGTFGYELDINRMPAQDAALIPSQIALYHRYGELIREGDYYRISSWQDNHLNDSYIVVNRDKTQALLFWVQVLGEPNTRSKKIRIPGLDPDKNYRIRIADPAVREDDQSGNFLSHREIEHMSGFLDKTLAGRTLAGAGLLMPKLSGDFRSVLLELLSE